MFEYFGQYYKRLDSNKDVEGRGTFERFIGIIGDDLDTELVNKSEDLLKNLIVADTFILPYYRYLIGHKGCSLYVGSTEPVMRRMIRVIDTLYRLRGTLKNYTYLFNLIPLTFELVWLKPEIVQGWDTPLKFDDDDRVLDTWTAVTAEEYGIRLTGAEDMSEDLMAAIKSVIRFNTPFYMRILWIEYNGIQYEIGDAERYIMLGYAPDGYTQIFYT